MNDPIKTAHERADSIFRGFFPAHGLAVRENQITLCHQMLDALFGNHILLCDAGTGIGKTYAYLVACVLWLQADRQGTPQLVTISTASVALQDAILKEYLPFLSTVLQEWNIIDRPLHGVIRKGKERFACDVRLAQRLERLSDETDARPRTRAKLIQLLQTCDLDAVPGLSAFDRAQVCVPEHCRHDCPGWWRCRYQQYLKSARGIDITFQICNHNYLLADVGHRQRGFPPLLKESRALVVDEAHKLPDAIRQMDTRRFSGETGADLCAQLADAQYTTTARRLSGDLSALWAAFGQGRGVSTPEGKNAAQEPFAANVAQWAALATVVQGLRQTVRHLSAALPRQTVHRLEDAAELLELFRQEDKDHILYIERGLQGSISLCATSRDPATALAENLWPQEQPALLTSGTLAAGGSFVRTEQQLGLVGNTRLRQCQVVAPFNYRHNCLLYLPKVQQRESEAPYLAAQIEALVLACHGHTLLLFTSYRLMDRVYRQVAGRLPFPTVQAWRGGQRSLELFKTMPNAVLFAAGPCWEGIDFPGDRVSLLVVPRLPFPVPDIIGNAVKEQYPDLHQYIQAVVVPEMQRKLRQGFGRAVRLETDTCVVAILDRRAAPGQRYHDAALQALPPCPVTDDILEIKRFIRERKAPDYFLS